MQTQEPATQTFCKYCTREILDIAGDTCSACGWIDPPGARGILSGTLRRLVSETRWKLNRALAMLARLYWAAYRAQKRVRKMLVH